MRFDEGGGIFWEPFVYKAARKTSADPKAKGPRILPPIPDTGWTPPRDFPDLSAAKALGIDIETCDPELPDKGPGVRRGDAFICGVSVSTSDGEFCKYFPVAHSMEPETNLDKDAVFRWLRVELARKHQPKVGANLLYDLDFLSAEAGVKVAGDLFDVQYADPLINEYEFSYSLDSIAERRLGRGKETDALYTWCSEAYGGKPNGDQRMNIWRTPPRLAGPYAEADARLPVECFREQVKIMREMGVMDIFRMECALIPLLLEMRQRGVPIDLRRVKEVDDLLTERIDIMQAKFGAEFSPNAPSDLLAICEREGIAYPLTQTGKPSFTKPWLMAHTHPALREVSEFRKVLKLRDTFIRGAMMGMQVGGRIHCEFNPLRGDDRGTVSGRFSSSNPNLQQIPARDPYWAPIIRSCFIPSEGRRWLKGDLSQIEFRLGAHYGIGESAEQVRDAYRNDPRTDFYNLAVAMTGLERQEAKSLSLGTLYGMRVKKFASMIGKDIDEASDIFAQFNERLPFMADTFDAFEREAKRFGFVRTIGGRVCHLDHGWERKALNRKLQGSCADWIKRSMLNAYQSGVLAELELYLTVHDELDVGVAPTRAGAEAAVELQRIMLTPYELSVPVLADMGLGSTWGDLGKVKTPDEIREGVLA